MAADHYSCWEQWWMSSPNANECSLLPQSQGQDPPDTPPSPMVRPTDTHPSPRVRRWLSRSEGMKSSSSSELKSLFFLPTAPPCRLHSTGWGEHTKANSLGKVHG